ncbi:MAG TPA: hypothetical protein VFF06_24375 [Polyangia bacterium]|nr:hypothetical protein [Polyangia bacterium]
MRRAALAVIWAHLAVVAVHGVAHAQLGLWPSPAEGAFIAAFIYLGPLAAALLLQRGRARAGMGVLAASMIGSLAFATHHHFIAVSPDHVAHLPPGAWRLPFQVTAYLAAPVDALGAALGAFALARRS